MRSLAVATALLMGAMGLALWFAPAQFVMPPAKLAVRHTPPKVAPPSALPSVPAIAPATPPNMPEHVVAALPLAPQLLRVDPALAGSVPGAVAERVAEKVPPALVPYFDVYLYVSKASSGPWAQHLFFFKKTEGRLGLVDSFAVSTGREADEQYFTTTPTGLFELDASRFMPMAYSAKWGDAEMPWAMFLDYSYRTQMTGVALHAAIGKREIGNLGHRASGGCVRLPLDKADALFHRFEADEQGLVPVFAFDPVRGTTNVEGRALHRGGRLLLSAGMRVLVVIEDDPGAAS